MPDSPLPTPAIQWPPCVLDIEASGFGRHSYPIEIGYVMPDGRASCMLVRPMPEWTHWDAAAETLHGIGRRTLEIHGQTVRAVALALNRELAGRTVYCDGWAHDYPWLAALFDAADMRAGFRLESVSALLDETRLTRLDAARQAALSEMGLTRHRASNDARALQRAVAQVSAPVR